jgi:hypothetical protein
MVPRAEGYTHDVGVWDLSIVQWPFSVAPCQTLALRFAGARRAGAVGTVWFWQQRETQHLCLASPLARGSAWAGGRDHTPSREPERWSTTSCREAAPHTPHAQPGTLAVEYHQLSRGSSTYTTRPAGNPSGGVPPAAERQLHLLT